MDYNDETQGEKIPLKGMSIGNQWTDPNTQILTHAAQAFYLGLVDERQSNHLLALAHEAIAKNLVSPLMGYLMLGRRYHWSFGIKVEDVRQV